MTQLIMEGQNMDFEIYVVIERWYERHYIDDGNDCYCCFGTLEEAKKYVDFRLEDNLKEMYEYYHISEDDEDAIKEFNEELHTINDDGRMVYGIYPYGGGDIWNEYKISEVYRINLL